MATWVRGACPTFRRRAHAGAGLRGAAAGVVLFSALAGAAGPMEGDLPRPTAAVISRDIAKRFADVDGLRLKWKVDMSVQLPIDNDEAANFSIQPEDEYAVAGDRRYRRFRNYSTGRPAAEGHFREVTFVMDGKVAHSQVVRHRGRTETPQVESYFLQHDGEGGTAPLREQAVHYLENIGSPYYDGKMLDVWRRQAHHTQQDSLAREEAFSVIEALDSGHYVIRSENEAVGDVSCVVTEYPGLDKLWLAPELGYALIKREWRWSKGGPLMMVYHNSAFDRVSPGLWLPRVTKREAYAHPKSGHEGEVHFTTTARITLAKAGALPESTFVFRPVPGSFAIDFTKVKGGDGDWKGITYTVGDDGEQTEAALKLAVAAQTSVIGEFFRFWRWSAGMWLIVGNVIVVTSVLAYFGLKRISRTGARGAGLGRIARRHA